MKKVVIVLIAVLLGNLSYAQEANEILTEANRALEAGRRTTAIDLYNQYIKVNDKNAEAFFSRAKATYWVWRLRGKEDKVLLQSYLSDVKRSFELDSTNSALNFWIAQNVELSRNLNKALTYFDRAIRYNNDSEAYYRNRAYCLMDIGKFSEAIDDFVNSNKLLINEYDQVMKKRLHEDNYGRMSLCYAKINQLDKAIRLVKKSIKSNSTNNMYQIYYATFLNLQGDKKKALKIYKNLIKKNPHLAISYLFVGNIYQSLGEIDLANEYYQVAKQKGFEVTKQSKEFKNQVDLLL